MSKGINQNLGHKNGGRSAGVWLCVLALFDLCLHLRVWPIAGWPGRWRGGVAGKYGCSPRIHRKRVGRPHPSQAAPHCLSGAPPAVCRERESVSSGERERGGVHLLQVVQDPSGSPHNDIRPL